MSGCGGGGRGMQIIIKTLTSKAITMSTSIDAMRTKVQSKVQMNLDWNVVREKQTVQ